VQYKLGRFDEALEADSRAYELFNAPSLLFDIGQCHRNLRSYERAIFFFEEYLREETNPARRTLANELIAESRAELEKQRLQPPDRSDQAPEGASTIFPREATMPTPALVDSADTAAPPPVPVTRRWWFWTAIGAGALVLATGAIALFGTGDTRTVPPSGSVGTLDRRP
jgi:tetratricopeptide (TPR) repeat protein